MTDQTTIALNLYDRLHLGHHILLERLAERPRPIAGVADGEFVGKDLELGQIVQPVGERVKYLSSYLQESEMKHISVRPFSRVEEILNIKGQVTIIMFRGPCCSEIEEQIVEAIRNRARNDFSFDLLNPVRADDGDKLSSARIRLGEIDRQGRSLRGTQEPPRRMGDELRGNLQTPKGEVFAAKDGSPEKRVVERIKAERPPLVIAVGDVTCATLGQCGYTPDVQVVDGITKRGAYSMEFHADVEYIVYNPAAVIYPEAWSVVDTAIHCNKRVLIRVQGEEDLIGFPAVLLAPDDAVLLYGQPNVGIVWVNVNEENRRLARAFLNEMPVIDG